MLVDLDDGVHRAADEPPEFLLALAHLRFDAQPAQLGRRPCGENLKQHLGARLGGIGRISRTAR